MPHVARAIFRGEKAHETLGIIRTFFMTFMLHSIIFLYSSHKFLDDDFNFHTKQIKTKIPTTTQGSNTGFLGENPIRKGKIPTTYGFFLCTQFSPKLLEFLLKDNLRETERV